MKGNVYRALDALCGTVFKEGKHKGERFIDVISKDPAYSKFLQDQPKKFKEVYGMFVTYADLMEMLPTMRDET